jgi:hypothetical protein
VINHCFLHLDRVSRLKTQKQPFIASRCPELPVLPSICEVISRKSDRTQSARSFTIPAACSGLFIHRYFHAEKRSVIAHYLFYLEKYGRLLAGHSRDSAEFLSIDALKIEVRSLLPSQAHFPTVSFGTLMDSDPELEVHVHVASEILTVRVRRMDSVLSILPQLNGYADCTLVHNGTILCAGFSFGFLGIENGAHLYTMPKPKQNPRPMCPSQIHSACKKMCDREHFTKLFAELQGPDYDPEFARRLYDAPSSWFVREMAKFKDRFFDRLEGTVKCHRRFVSQWFRCSEPDSSEDEEKTKKDKNQKKG